MSQDLHALRPAFIRNCRLNDERGMILMPEGVIQLKGSAIEVLRLCDGRRALGEILSEVKSRHKPDAAEKIEKETIEFLSLLRTKRVIDFT